MEVKTMKKVIGLLLSLVLISTQLCSCKNEDEERKRSYFYIKSAWQMNGDGWVYCLKYTNPYDENEDITDLMQYAFLGINLRYRYDDKYIEVYERKSEKDGSVYVEKVIPSCLLFGSGSDAQKRDQAKINEILRADRKAADVLAEDPADYEFEELDKDMFFRLIHDCLTAPVPEDKQDITYWEKYGWALMSEQMYIDGYKFQVGYINTMGYIDVVYIDVLYETGSGYRDYIQLSDVIDSGKASEEQKEAFELMRKIASECMENESYVATADNYKDRTVAGIDFGRLYTFLYNIHINNDAQYIVRPISDVA